MKIAIIMPEFDIGGAEIMAENLAYSLIEKGQDVLVVSLFTLHTVLTDRMEKNGVRIRYLNKKPGFDLSMIPALVRVFREEKPDVIHTHRNSPHYAVPAAAIAGIRPRVHTVHSVAEREAKGADKLSHKFFARFMKMKLVAISPQVRRSISVMYHQEEENVPLVYNGIDLDLCVPRKDRDGDSTIRLIHVGRFVDVKNQANILHAFRRVHDRFPQTSLSFYGKGKNEEECKKISSELGLDSCVRFCGVTDHIYEPLSKSDIFLLCSLWEGMPITLIEAMAAGLPAVGTRVGGIPDMLIDGETGLLCETDVNDMAETIGRMVGSRELRKKCGDAALLAARKYSSSAMADGYLAIYRRLCDGNETDN